MEREVYLGVDNGVSGTYGIITKSTVIFNHVPTKSEQSYTKTKNKITRIDFPEWCKILEQYKNVSIFALVERPMINPGRFKATMSALRSLESILIGLEQYNIPFQYIDSKEWQKVILPSGYKGEQLKEVSLEIGNRLYPQFKTNKHTDRDGLLIAEYAKRMKF